MKRWMLIILMFAPVGAMAGDIYTCKGLHGEKVYQNTPCATEAAQLAHSTFVKPAAAPTRMSDASGIPDDITWSNTQTVVPAETERYRAPVPRAAAPRRKVVAYVCQVDDKRWMQLQPCPATQPVEHDADVDGYTASGEPVSGWGTYTEMKPVQETPVDDQQICAALGAFRTLRGAGDDAGQSYERNKLKRNYCGG